MDIEQIKAFPLSCELEEGGLASASESNIQERQLTLIRAETDDGIVGWGEAFGPPQTNQAMLEEVVSDFVIGMDPFDVERLQDQILGGFYHFRTSGPLMSVISGVDIAMWDILGKYLDRPVSRILGGNNRETVTPYASTMMTYDSETGELNADSSEVLERAVADGFNAAKIKLGRGIDDDINRAKVARDILGDDGILMVDMNANYKPHQAVQAAEALDPYEVYWIEEPVDPRNYSGYREFKEHCTTPLAAGEAVYSRFEFEHLMNGRKLDIAQPDVTKCGGLTGARYVAKTATRENISISPHCWHGPISLAATIHFALTIPKFPHSAHRPEPIFVEIDQSENPLREELLVDPIEVDEKAVSVPNEPGLGVTPERDVIDQYRLDR
jgi:D-galactarolactone cycloisomerase